MNETAKASFVAIAECTAAYSRVETRLQLVDIYIYIYILLMYLDEGRGFIYFHRSEY